MAYGFVGVLVANKSGSLEGDLCNNRFRFDSRILSIL